MQEWNVVASIKGPGFERACKILGNLGTVKRTEFFNVLLMRVEDMHQLLETLRQWTAEDPRTLSFISRLVPIAKSFTFRSPEEFQTLAREITLEWLPELAGKDFYVRMRRRGFKGKLSSHEEERFLDDILLQSLEKTGTPSRIAFDNPDVIIVIETVGSWAGMSLCTREYLEQYPFIRVD